MSINESIIEDAAPEGFEVLEHVVGHGPNLALDEPAESKGSLGMVLWSGGHVKPIIKSNIFSAVIIDRLRRDAAGATLRVMHATSPRVSMQTTQ